MQKVSESKIDTYGLKKARAGFVQNLFLIAVIAGIFVTLSIIVDGFFSVNNIINILRQVTPIGIMACGLTFVMITGGIDISLPSIMAMAAVFSVSGMAANNSTATGIIIIILIGIVVGLFNGFAVAYLRMVPMVVTLSTMTIAAGIATAYTNGLSIVGVTQGFLTLFNKYTVIVLFVLVVVILSFVVKRTVYGRWLYCIGNNQNTAAVSGIPIKFAIMISYAVAGLCAALAGIVNISSIAAARDTMGPDSQIIDIVSATIIGGVSINGGYGSPAGAALGAIFIIMISNIINMVGVSDFYTGLIKGIIMIVAIFFDVLRNRSGEIRG